MLRFDSGIEPSGICLGTARLGSAISRADSFALLDGFAAMGGNFLDTANVYASWLNGGEGASERTIGEWIRAHGTRKNVIIGTKGGHPPLGSAPQYGDCCRATLERHVSQSIERLGVERLDLFWLHRDDPGREVAEIVETMADFRRDGRIALYGLSNWTTERIDAARAYAAAHGLPPPVASQPGWSLAEPPADSFASGGLRFMDETTRKWHEANGMPVVPYSPMANGFFGPRNVEWARGGFGGAIPTAAAHDSPANRRRLIRAIELADQKGCTAAQIALAYLRHQPFAVYPIVGTGKPDRLREAWEALSVSLADSERFLDEV